MADNNSYENSSVTFNVWVLDDLSAHHMFLKDKYDKTASTSVSLFTKLANEKTEIFLRNKNINLVLIFVYGRRGLYKILDFIGLNIKVVVCAHEYDLWWLTNTLPKIELIDLSMPKEELFTAINSVIVLEQKRGRD